MEMISFGSQPQEKMGWDAQRWHLLAHPHALIGRLGVSQLPASAAGVIVTSALGPRGPLVSSEASSRVCFLGGPCSLRRTPRKPALGPAPTAESGGPGWPPVPGVATDHLKAKAIFQTGNLGQQSKVLSSLHLESLRRPLAVPSQRGSMPLALPG